jgi:hypothetical protein
MAFVGCRLDLGGCGHLSTISGLKQMETHVSNLQRALNFFFSFLGLRSDYEVMRFTGTFLRFHPISSTRNT